MNLVRFQEAAESLSPESVGEFTKFYADNAIFIDPFQTVHGRLAIQQIYTHMFKSLDRPQFRNIRPLGGPLSDQALEVMVGWDFEFALSPHKPRQRIAGCSLLELNAQGLITRHTDFWDASRVFQALPILGPIIRWLRGRIGHSSQA